MWGVEEIQFSRNILIVCLKHLRYFVCHGSKVWKLPFWFALKTLKYFLFVYNIFPSKVVSWKSFVPQNVFSFSESRFALVEAPSTTFLCRINGNLPEMRAHQLPHQQSWAWANLKCQVPRQKDQTPAWSWANVMLIISDAQGLRSKLEGTRSNLQDQTMIMDKSYAYPRPKVSVPKSYVHI